jgi:hypothetical protein
MGRDRFDSEPVLVPFDRKLRELLRDRRFKLVDSLYLGTVTVQVHASAPTESQIELRQNVWQMSAEEVARFREAMRQSRFASSRALYMPAMPPPTTTT